MRHRLDSTARFALAASAIYLALGAFVFRLVLAGECFYGGDVYKYFLPAWVEVSEQLRQGSLPVWSSHWSCGAPVLGALTPAPLYPPVFVLAWLPPLTGFALCLAGHVPFAALGLACFLRQQRVAPAAAIVGGAAFGFSGFALSLTSICPSALYVVAWSGWLLLLLERLLRQPGPGRAAALTLAACMIPLAGEPQYALHLALALLAWTALRPAQGPRLRGLGWTAACVALTGLLAAAVLVPALEVMTYGGRQESLSYAYAADWPVLPRQLATLGAPFAFGSSLQDFPNPTAVLTHGTYPYLFTLYLGALPLLACGAAPWTPRRRLGAFFLVCALGFGLMALGQGFGVHRLVYEGVPLYDRFRFPYKAWPGAALGLAGLAALGLEVLLRARARADRASRVAPLALAGLALALLLTPRGLFLAWTTPLAAGQPPVLAELVATRLQHGAYLFAGVAAVAACALTRRCPPRLGRTLVCALAVLELAVSVRPAVATAPAAALQPERVVAAEVSPRLHLTPFLARYGQIEAFERLPDYVGWATHEAQVANTARWSGGEHFRGCDEAYASWHERTYLLSEALPPEPRVRLLAACGVEVLTSSLPPLSGLERERDLGGGLYRARVVDAFPRAFWVPEAREVDDQEQALRALAEGTLDLGRVALIPSAAAQETPTQAGDAEPLELEPDGLPGPRWSEVPAACPIELRGPSEVRVRAPGEAGVVVLLDVWFPGWEVEVDGEPRPLLRTNFAWRGVEVGPTDREVRFSYRPSSVRLGFALSAVGGLLLAALVAASFVSRSNRDAG